IGITLYNILFMYGLHYSSASHSALFISLSPLFAALIMAATGKERISNRMLSGLALATFGALVIIGSGGRGFSFTSSAFLGDLITLGASVLWALYTINARPLLAKYPPSLVTAWAMIAGSIMLLPVSLRELGNQNWSAISAGSWTAFLFAAVVAGGIAHTLWYDGVKRIGVTRTVVYHYLMPFAAVAFAAVFLRERITLSQIAGGISILVGVALVQQKRS
ncbi:MAG: DMT family transporter, partial [Nitrospirota bacterium]|nr:DMT family transporter [Nitrospirota bacterium]